jgi:hypothetical protein
MTSAATLAPEETDPGGARFIRRTWSRVAARALRRPVITVVIVAGIVRVAFALASFALNSGTLIPDEIQYIDLARVVADGHTADSWAPFYGQSLYNSTRLFSGSLRFTFDLLGPSRIWGQLLAATFGTATAGLTAALCRRHVRPALALGGGIFIAVLPSQVLWSSVVLRESMVWTALAVVAAGLLITRRTGARWLVAGTGTVALALLCLGVLREQTLVAAGWSAVLVAPLLAPTRRLWRTTAIAAVAVTIPILGGLGPGGWNLVTRAVPSLGSTRTNMAIAADSAFVPTSIVNRPSNTRIRPDDGSGAHATSTTTTAPSQDLVASKAGDVYRVDNSAGGSARSFLPGIAAVAFRPFPWEGGSDLTSRFAAMEDLLWYALYAGGIAALVLSRGERRSAAAFPAVLTAVVIGIGALTQGNLGTAFRHRGQYAWALVLLTAIAVEELIHRRDRGRRSDREGGAAGSPPSPAP